MRAGRATRGADGADPVAGHDAAPARYVDAAQVRVPARHAEPVADDDQLAVARVPAHGLDAAAAGRRDRRARGRWEVEAGVEHAPARAEAVADGHPQRAGEAQDRA